MRKVPFIPQFNTTECGVCVLTMILHYFGAYHSLQEVREHLPVTRDGATIRMLINAFAHYGIEANAFHAVIDRDAEFGLPAIINWENNHYVILERLNHDGVWIVDSNVGRFKMTYEEFHKKYSGIIIFLKKTETFKKVRRNLHFKNSFSPFLSIYKSKIMVLLLLTFLARLFTVAIPIFIQRLVDDMTSRGLQISHVIFLIVSILLSSVFLYLKGHHSSVFGVQIDRDVNTGLISKLLRVPYNFYDRKSNAEIFYALDNVTCVRGIYLDNIMNCVFDVLTMLFVLAYLFHMNTAAFMVVLIVLIPNVFVLALTDAPIQRDLRLMIKEQSGISGHQVEMIYSILGIKASSVEGSVFGEWQEKYDAYFRKNRDYQIKFNIFHVVLSTLITLSPVIVLVISIMYAQKGLMTIGVALAFYTMSDILFNSANTVLNAIRSFRNNLISLERLEDIMQSEDGVLSCDEDIEINLEGDIEVRNVSFQYAQESENVLKDISCIISQNSKVAIVGSSGSGKSTLLKVISGLYNLRCGEILYNGNDINSKAGVAIKRQIGFVAQNTWLMNKSIIENIILGLSDVTMEEVEEACRIVNIHEEIMQMPMRYQTIISETGKNISGGQCQRIILARMVLLKPKVLLLDEATSALDVINEKKILDYFYQMNCTVIMISHKLEFLKNCDNIIVMKEGEISTQGTYSDLIEHSAEFKCLLK